MSTNCNNGIRYAHKIDGCKSQGGVTGVALATFSGSTAGALGFTANNLGLITGVVNSGGTNVFYFQAQHPEKAFANVKSDFSDDGLAGGYLLEGSLFFNKNNYLLRNKVVDMTNTVCLAIVKYNNGTYRLFGEEYGVSFASDEQSGTALKDLNGVTMTMKSNSNFNPRFIDPVIAEQLFNYDTVIVG